MSNERRVPRRRRGRPSPGAWALQRAAVVVTLATTCLTVGGCSAPAPDRVPEDVGQRITEQLDEFLAIGDPAERVRAILVQHRGELVVERYTGASAEDYWDVQSIGKSVMATLLGIAMEEGHLDGVEQTLADLLPDYAADMTPSVAAVTLHELLSHTAGFSPDQPRFLDEPIWSSPDWVRHVLADPLPDATVVEPFVYSSAASHLMAPILVEATGRPVLDYAREVLLDPLGIASRPSAEPVVTVTDGVLGPWYEDFVTADFAWPVDPQGFHIGPGSIKLRARDLAALGQMYLDDGRWEGGQVAPSAWVARATTSHTPLDGRLWATGYGYMWWLAEYDGDVAFEARGAGGQRIVVVPDRELVVVVAAEFDLRDPLAEIDAVSDSVLHELISTYVLPHF